MLTGGLPHAAGANIVSGPTSLSPGTATIIVNQNMPGVNVGDSCAVDIFNGAFQITMSIVVAGNAFFPQTDPFFSRFSHAFGFRGTAVDSIAIDSGGVVYAFSMTNGIGNKVVVRPNLALVGDGSETGSDAKVYAADGVSYYLCK